MLQLTHPEHAAFLFHDFVAGKGTEAVLNVVTFLERRHALDKSADRKTTRAADHEALAVIEQTGTTRQTLDELKAFVDTVQSVAPAETASAAPDADADADAERLATLRKIYAWITAWGEVARTAVTRRDQLIRLGLAKRRAAKAKRAPAPPAAPTAPAVPVMKLGAGEQPPESRAA